MYLLGCGRPEADRPESIVLEIIYLPWPRLPAHYVIEYYCPAAN